MPAAGFTWPDGQTASAVSTHSRSSALVPETTVQVVEESSGSGSTAEQGSGVPATTVPDAASADGAGARASSGPGRSAGAATEAISKPAATTHRPTRRGDLAEPAF